MSFRVVRDGDFEHVEGKDGESLVVSLSATGATTGTVQATVCKLGKLVTLQLTEFFDTLSIGLLTLSGFPAVISPSQNFLFTTQIIDNGSEESGWLTITPSGTIVFSPIGVNAQFSAGTGGFNSTSITYVSK